MDSYKNPVVLRKFFGTKQQEHLRQHLDSGVVTNYKDEPRQVNQDYCDIPYETKEYIWAYRKVWDIVNIINDREWGFHLSGWQQPLRVASYGPKQQFDWHSDYTPDDGSKIAVSIDLGTKHLGGSLHVLESGSWHPRDGYGAVFPAFLGHKVEPIIGGTRTVLLAWITGPRFR